MNTQILHKLFSVLIALVWLVNGLYCKILNYVPRHEEIVSRILGHEHASLITNTIGVLEMLMVVWILTSIKSKLNAIVQIGIIILMNIIELTLAKDLLLFGYGNIIFAMLFSAFIYFNEFHLKDKNVQS